MIWCTSDVSVPINLIDIGNYQIEMAENFFLCGDSSVSVREAVQFLEPSLQTPVDNIMREYVKSVTAEEKIFAIIQQSVRIKSVEDLSSLPPHPDTLVILFNSRENELVQAQDDRTIPFRNPTNRNTGVDHIVFGDSEATHKLCGRHLDQIVASDIPSDYIIYCSTSSHRNRGRSSDTVDKSFYGYALSRMYHYLICGGNRYGYLATAETITFLHVPRDDPTTLHYYPVVYSRTPPIVVPFSVGCSQWI